MAGLVPAIHVSLAANPKDVDAGDKPGHNGICKLRRAYFIASAGSMNFFTTNAL